MAWQDGLSPEQESAASAPGPHTRLLSGPGTGKTRTITNRIAFLIEELSVDAEDILVLTFGRAAARELRERLDELSVPVPMVSTIHAFALRQLLKNGGAPELPTPIFIADDFDERYVVDEDLKTILRRSVRQVQKSFQNLASDWETLNVETEDWESNHPDPAFLAAFREHRTVYGYTLRSELVYRVKRALQERPEFEIEREFRYVIVDEYQDLNKCELAVVQALEARGADLFVAGDDDQSIYSFRHAFPQGIREFSETYPGAAEEELEVCHRCAKDILAVARAVAEQDVRSVPKALRPREDAPDGVAEVLAFRNGSSEAEGVAALIHYLVNVEGVPANEVLVLQRMDRANGFSQPIIEALDDLGIRGLRISNPFAILEESDGRQVVCALRLLVNREDSLAWRELLELRKNGVGGATLRAVYDLAREQGGTFAAALQTVRANPGVLQAANRSRLAADLEAIEEILEKGEPLLEEEMPAALTQLLQLVLERDDVAEYFEVLLLLAGEDPKSLQQVFSGLQAVRDYIDEVMRQGEEDAVRFMSMHAAKGLTATAVIVPNCEDQLIPGNAEGEVEEGDERRLLYVSLTRARSHLYVTYAAKRSGLQARAGRADSSHQLTRFLQGIVSPRQGEKFVADLPES